MAGVNKNRLTNDHFLYVESGTATNDQLISCLTEAIQKYLVSKPKSFSPKFKSNIITKHDGTTYGYGYVWVEDLKLSNILIGLNPDGSKRVKEIEDTDWVADSNVEKEYHEWLSLPLVGKSWVEIADIEDEFQAKLTRPKLYQPLEPLIVLEGFKMLKASVSEKESHITTNKLFCSSVHSDIHEKDIKEVFEPFSTSKSMKKGSSNQHRYPEIGLETKKGSSTVLVTFDPSTNDGMFALLMTRRVLIKGHTLYFDYFKSKK